MSHPSVHARCTPPCLAPRRRLRGFTAIELMVTISILAILAAIAAPSFTPLMERWRVRQAAEALQSSIYYARSEAIKRGGGVMLDFTQLGEGWKVINTNDGKPLQEDTTPAKIAIALQDNADTAISKLYIDRWGMVSDAPTTAAKHLNFLVKPSGKADTAASALRLCLGQGGRIKHEPNGGDCDEPEETTPEEP